MMTHMVARFDIMYPLKALWAVRSRAFLSALGIVIGVMSVLIVASVGLSAQDLIVSQVTTFGGDLIGIIPGASEDDEGPPPIAYGVVMTTLDLDDADAIEKLPDVTAVVPYVRRPETVNAGREQWVTTVNGVSEHIQVLSDLEVTEGRFFSANDIDRYARVAVLGLTPAENLFPEGRAVGQHISINDIRFEVIGVLEEKGTSFFENQDDQILVPVTTAQRLVAGIDYVNYIRVKTAENADVAFVKDDIRNLLRRRHRIKDEKDDFTLRSTDQAAEMLGNVTGAMQGFLMLVTAISLIVGGINIMNIMFVSVRERRREIGLRKALGANNARIRNQFLTESAAIALFGGLIGAAFGIGFSYLAAIAIAYAGYSWTFFMPVSYVLFALIVASAIGIASGVSPAVQASRLDPIVALREE